MAQAARAPRVICLINKSDRPLAFAPEELRSRFPHLCVVSAATGAGLDALGETVAALFPAGGAESAGELLTNARQADACLLYTSCCAAIFCSSAEFSAPPWESP